MARRRLVGVDYPKALIVTGGCVFIFVLWLSAYWQSDIRRLHFFQAWMYVAAIVLSLRRSRWGYFVGISAAAFWNYTTLFVNTFFVNGIHWLLASVRSGEWKRADQIIAVPAWTGNLLLLIGCIWAYLRLRDRNKGDIVRFLAAFCLTTGFFAAAVALCQPRYLPLFRLALHPRWPW
jgi:hypothetical protein